MSTSVATSKASSAENSIRVRGVDVDGQENNDNSGASTSRTVDEVEEEEMAPISRIRIKPKSDPRPLAELSRSHSVYAAPSVLEQEHHMHLMALGSSQKKETHLRLALEGSDSTVGKPYHMAFLFDIKESTILQRDENEACKDMAKLQVCILLGAIRFGISFVERKHTSFCISTPIHICTHAIPLYKTTQHTGSLVAVEQVRAPASSNASKQGGSSSEDGEGEGEVMEEDDEEEQEAMVVIFDSDEDEDIHSAAEDKVTAALEGFVFEEEEKDKEQDKEERQEAEEKKKKGKEQRPIFKVPPVANLQEVLVLGEVESLESGEKRVWVRVKFANGTTEEYSVLVSTSKQYSISAYFENEGVEEASVVALRELAPACIVGSECCLKLNGIKHSSEASSSSSGVISHHTGAEMAVINAFMRWIKTQLQMDSRTRCLKILLFRLGMKTKAHIDFPSADGWMRYLIEAGNTNSRLIFPDDED